MEGMEYFYELFEALPRGGPGSNEFTRQAFQAIPEFIQPPLILDIGCGQGVQTVELAKISNGKIIAVDNHQAFLDTLMRSAKLQGVAANITPMNISMFEMDFDEQSFDIIWSEGALYFMGFQNGLRRCHQLLKDPGYLAVTELVYLSSPPPAPLVQYLESEYPDIKTVPANIELIKTEGFQLLSHFTLPKSAWLDGYYLPIETELSRLKKKYQGNEVALQHFDVMSTEIAYYKQFSDHYGYEFFVMQKTQKVTPNPHGIHR
ncbi:class I SAM-dependent methyltransferase [Kaarinaea lacus]